MINSPLSKRVESGARLGARPIMGSFGGRTRICFQTHPPFAPPPPPQKKKTIPH